MCTIGPQRQPQFEGEGRQTVREVWAFGAAATKVYNIHSSLYNHVHTNQSNDLKWQNVG